MSRVNYHANPEAFSLAVPEKGVKKLVLGIDLGTATGYSLALYEPGVSTILPSLLNPNWMGQLDLSAGSYDSGAIRFVKLRHFLAVAKPDLVVYEDVKFTPPPMPGAKMGAILARAATSSEFLGALKATMAAWCEENGIPCTGFGISEIKKRATGKGNSDKKKMIQACNEAFGSTFDPDGYETSGADNVADSAWVCLLGLERYADGIPPNG